MFDSSGTHGGKRIMYRILVEKPEGNNYLENVELCGEVILKWIKKG
jgi:hypothetical protein